MPINMIPQEFRNAYDLDAKAKNDLVYMEIICGMYGLLEAGILAKKMLRARLAKFGYFKLPHTPGLWKHIYRPIYFTLVVDDLGIKCVREEHAEHLTKAVRIQYLSKVDRTEEDQIGM